MVDATDLKLCADDRDDLALPLPAKGLKGWEPLASAGLVGAALFLSTERRRLMSAKALALLGDDADEDGGESKRLHELRSRISNAAIV